MVPADITVFPPGVGFFCWGARHSGFYMLCLLFFFEKKWGGFLVGGAAKVVVFCIWGRGGRIHNSTARTPLLHNPRHKDIMATLYDRT